MLCIDARRGECELCAQKFGPEIAGAHGKWWGAVLVPGGEQGTIVFVPEDATRIIKFDVASRTAMMVGDELPVGRLKWHGACMSHGLVVACPSNRGGRKVLVFDPSTDKISYVGPDLGGEDKKWSVAYYIVYYY